MKANGVGGVRRTARFRGCAGVLRHARSAVSSLAVSCLAMIAAIAGARAQAVTIDWVTVGDPGNAADTNPAGYGAVASGFRIMKYEWTNAQYVQFLNAVDPNGTNPNGIYDTSMGNDARGGISFTGANAAGSKYAVRTDMSDKPVNFVSWWDAARVANWLHNGQGSGSTETGAYTLNNATSGNAPAVNSGVQFFVPTEDQWFKAAYYKGGGTNAGYWDYATQSDAAPTPVTAGATGIGSAGSTGNFANYNDSADWNGQNGNVTTIATNGGTSAYGAFDLSGNVYEWNDLTGAASSTRGLRGGGWYHTRANYLMSSDRYTLDPAFYASYAGFRLASPASSPSGVPEIDPSGLRLAAALLAGGFALRERRRRAG